jgi:hypothetical protein
VYGVCASDEGELCVLRDKRAEIFQVTNFDAGRQQVEFPAQGLSLSSILIIDVVAEVTDLLPLLWVRECVVKVSYDLSAPTRQVEPVEGLMGSVVVQDVVELRDGFLLMR